MFVSLYMVVFSFKEEEWIVCWFVENVVCLFDGELFMVVVDMVEFY